MSIIREAEFMKFPSSWDIKLNTFILQNHLESLTRALRDYISEQKQELLTVAISKLKEELDFDSTAINQLHFAIYLFKDAVNEILKMHSIKPHWIFALDNLVTNAVQAAITVLSPGKITFFFQSH